MPILKVSEIKHPLYVKMATQWHKWRLTYEAGDDFINEYLKLFSIRETLIDFQSRKDITYVPSFAKAAVNDIKNSIFSRIAEVTRKGGTTSYQSAITGKMGGVDLSGSTMNSFIGRKILPELLSMSKIGVYVDMPSKIGPTLADNGDKHPYIYTYQIEDIMSWALAPADNVSVFKSVLLRDTIYITDTETNLPTNTIYRFRQLYLITDETGKQKVAIKFFDANGERIDLVGDIVPADTAPMILEINKIPLVIFEITNSLLCDACQYQVAHMNIASSDVAYIVSSNFPFYTEQFDPRTDSPYTKQSQPTKVDPAAQQVNAILSVEEQQQLAVNNTTVGSKMGRKYPKGVDRPGFIHPSPEPLNISIEKQREMKAEVRQLVNLAVADLQPTRQSAESKRQDQQGLESGLSYIGLELEHGENLIADYWAMYEGSEAKAVINYPSRYNLKTDSEMLDEAESKKKLALSIPSPTLRKIIAKDMALLIGAEDVDNDTLVAIEKEIDSAAVPLFDPSLIQRDVEDGVLSASSGANLRGYPKDDVIVAQQEQADRLARIQSAQNPAARGNPDGSADPALAAQLEKLKSQNPDAGGKPGPGTRGAGK